MKVRLLHTADVSPGHVRSAFSGLAPPLVPGESLPHRGSFASFYDRARAQYDAFGVLETVPAPEPGWLNLLLLGADLFVPALTYVFGLSHLAGGRGILSVSRLKPPEENELSERVLVHRLRVEVAHELGHAAGLVHCAVNDCAMHRSLWPESVDLKNPEFCASCRARLPEAP
ncbi:MAG: peptidase M54 [Holophagales bacterium]|nr:peptidase M54 [Holophagales bacterium]